jgi:hypothetical protein
MWHAWKLREAHDTISELHTANLFLPIQTLIFFLSLVLNVINISDVTGTFKAFLATENLVECEKYCDLSNEDMRNL